MRWIITLLVALLVPSVSLAWEAEQLLDETDVSADVNTRWVVSRDDYTTLWCKFDVTAIDQGAVQLGWWVCKTPGAIPGACTDDTDSSLWFWATAAITTVSDAYFIASPINPTITNDLDVEFLGPLPPVWMFEADQSGGATLTYTLDCWWK